MLEFLKKWKQNEFENFPFLQAKSGQNISKRGNSRIDWIWLNCPIHIIWRLFVMEAVSDLFIQPLDPILLSSWFQLFLTKVAQN